VHDASVILVKAAAGGTLVVVFALLGEVLRPKWLAGLFSAAPSIAIAGLIVTVVDKGDHAASQAALGMVFGAAGFVVFAACARPLLSRFHAVLASALACVAWVVVALGSFLLVLR
jgi:uncharacterized membrane protein (GlpM family)